MVWAGPGQPSGPACLCHHGLGNGPRPVSPPLLPSPPPHRKVEDLQFRVEEESITKGDLEVTLGQGPAPALTHGCGIQRDSLGGSWEDDQREKWGKVKGHILECERGRASLEQFSWGVRAGIGSTPGTPGGCMGRQVQDGPKSVRMPQWARKWLASRPCWKWSSLGVWFFVDGKCDIGWLNHRIYRWGN